jgi:hypothetical protein
MSVQSRARIASPLTARFYAFPLSPAHAVSRRKAMERRYNIVDGDDIKIAKSLMQAGRKKASA